MLPSSVLNGGSIVQVTAYQLPFTAKTSAGTLWLVDGMKVLPDEVSRLERFRGNSVAGGRRERLLGTLSRWFVPFQVGGGKGYLERFCGNSVADGRQGHTVVLRRAFPHCGPLPFSGADAGFGHSMSLSFRMILAPDVLT